MTSNIALHASKNTDSERSFACLGDEYARIEAFGSAMGWDDKPFLFVIQQYRRTLETR